MSHSHDAIIIGTGQAGPPLARRLSTAGMSVAIVERHLFGGTCVNTGCIPKKAMVASAYIAHASRRERDFGVTVEGDIRVDMKNVKARKDRIAERSRAGLERMLRGLPRCEVNRRAAILALTASLWGEQSQDNTRPVGHRPRHRAISAPGPVKSGDGRHDCGSGDNHTSR